MFWERSRPATALAALLFVGCSSADPAPEAGAPTETAPTVVASASEIPDTSAPSAAAAETVTAVPRFSKARAMDHVRKLARDIGIRERATPNEKKGARYVARRFRSYGYDVTIQRFAVDDATSRNVVASWPGARAYGLVIGAHMDSVPVAPGANDNASGTSVVLELARIFAGTDQASLIRFVGFGSEEFGDDGRHHVGSQVYVTRLEQKGRNRLAGAISVDMVADGRPLLVGNSNIAHDVVARTLYRRVKRHGTNVRYETLCDCSDHGPFEHAGIPGAFAYSGPEPDYHSTSDTVVNLRPRDLLRTGRALRAFLEDVDLDMLRRFRRH